MIPTDLTPAILQGHVLDVLRTIPENSIHCAVTSPPFWGLRRYDLCGCAQDYVRGDGPNPMPKKADGAVRVRDPDPECRWCGGTGQLPGMENLWGGEPSCEHVWKKTKPRRQRGENDAPNSPLQQGNRGATYDALGGRFCERCGAWFGSLGLEPTPSLYVEHMVSVLRELRRVLRSDGTLWLEIGDTYSTHPAGLTGAKRWKASGLRNRDQTGAEQAGSVDKRNPEVKEKELCMIPARVALALSEDGWYLRAESIWHRPNPMPESVRDRPTRAHSTVYLLTKRADYFYDPDAVREPQSGGAHSRGNLSVQKLAPEDSNIRSKPSFHASMHDLPPGTGRNLRSVWTIPTQAFSESHYATFPTRLPEICISAGTSERGCCPECGAPFERVVGLGEPQRDWQARSGGDRNGRYEGNATKDYLSAGAEDASEVKRRILDSMRERLTVGWTPTCRCFPDPCDRCGVPWDRRTVVRKVSTFNVRVRDAKTGVLGFKSGLGGATADASADEVGAYEGGSSGSSSPYRYREVEVSWPGCKCRQLVPAIVMDPFVGSGTTLAVARRLYRRSVGVELSAYYTDMARRRLTEVSSKLAPRPVSQARLSEFAEVPA